MAGFLSSTALILGLILTVNYNFIVAGTTCRPTSTSQNLFAADLLSVIMEQRSNENVVYSPASIQTCLVLAFMGAKCNTAEEMRRHLKLGQGDKLIIAQRYGEFLRSNFGTNDEKAPQLRMANRIYVNNQLKVLPEYNALTQKYLQSQAITLDFGQSKEATDEINTYVAEQTNNKIQNLLQPTAVNMETSAILVNAIYFKGKWLKPFSNSSTTKMPFHRNARECKNVDMMFNDDKFKYAELPEYDAKVIELPYANSEISMLIILPNKIEGLKKLEDKLKGKDLNELSSRMSQESVKVFLPKFRIEYDIDLKESLKKMGLTSMFSQTANFKGLFDTAVSQMVSDVKHKAFLDVNEAGSEAAAATYIKIVPTSLNLNQKTLRADHPFFFAIRSKTSIYFTGHLAKLD